MGDVDKGLESERGRKWLRRNGRHVKDASEKLALHAEESENVRIDRGGVLEGGVEDRE